MIFLQKPPICLIGVFNGFSIMKLFFAEVFHTDNGVTCSERGHKDLSTAQGCSDAVGYAKTFNSKALYKNDGSWSNNPKGCYIWTSGDMFFNTHSIGERRSSAASICMKGST